MNCDLCKYFETGKGPDLETLEGFLRMSLTLCPDCFNWLEKILHVRTRFLNEYYKSVEGVKDY